ncbi:MAG: MAPEG family protein [Alphaproteobacteria bacterium]|nr:MAPEG family protein [Alphaproteobacteria bacterium]
MSTALPAIVTCLALGLYFYMGLRVGQARTAYDIKAPATTGHPVFERLFRIQMNTLEWLIIFLPSLWLFSAFVSPWIAALLGLVWIAGRYLYMEGYAQAPEERGTGFIIQGIATGLLFLGAFIGAIIALF